jgi:hypothetical protein
MQRDSFRNTSVDRYRHAMFATLRIRERGTASLPQTDLYPSAGTPLIDYIADSWESEALGCHETNPQNYTYHPFGRCEEDKSVQCGIKKKGMNISKMYFSHWKPPGVFERMWSVNLDALNLGDYQTPGGNSGQPSD